MRNKEAPDRVIQSGAKLWNSFYNDYGVGGWF